MSKIDKFYKWFTLSITSLAFIFLTLFSLDGNNINIFGIISCFCWLFNGFVIISYIVKQQRTILKLQQAVKYQKTILRCL